MLAVRVLGAIDAPTGQQTREVGNADAKHLPGQDVVDAILEVRHLGRRAQQQDVLLDWRELHGLAHEARISRLAGWVELAEREGRRYRLRLSRQADFGPGRGPEHRHACLRALALLPQA